MWYSLAASSCLMVAIQERRHPQKYTHTHTHKKNNNAKLKIQFHCLYKKTFSPSKWIKIIETGMNRQTLMVIIIMHSFEKGCFHHLREKANIKFLPRPARRTNIHDYIGSLFSCKLKSTLNKVCNNTAGPETAASLVHVTPPPPPNKNK